MRACVSVFHKYTNIQKIIDVFCSQYRWVIAPTSGPQLYSYSGTTLHGAQQVTFMNRPKLKAPYLHLEIHVHTCKLKKKTRILSFDMCGSDLHTETDVFFPSKIVDPVTHSLADLNKHYFCYNISPILFFWFAFF